MNLLKLFPGIEEVCKNCSTCCRTYGWLLKKEADNFIEKDRPVIKINKNLFCIDSFNKTKTGKRILNKIPRCRFYKNNRCEIHGDKPLDCRLFPIKIMFKHRISWMGVSLGCKYVSSLSEKEKQVLFKRVEKFIKRMPNDLLQSYIDMMYNIHKISKPKKFWMEKIIPLKLVKDKWMLKTR